MALDVERRAQRCAYIGVQSAAERALMAPVGRMPAAEGEEGEGGKEEEGGEAASGAAAGAVAPGGFLVVFNNSHSMKRQKWMAMVVQGLEMSGRSAVDVTAQEQLIPGEQLLGKSWCLRTSPDFNDDGDEPDLKGAIFQLL